MSGHDLILISTMQQRRRTLHALYVLETLDLSKRKDAAAMRDIFRLAKELDIAVNKVPRHELNLLSDDRQHQVRGLMSILMTGSIGGEAINT